MCDLQNIQNQITEKLLSSLVEGYERFPVPNPQLQPIFFSNSENPCSHIVNCRGCSLSESRKRVVVEKSFDTKHYFVLSDFPDSQDVSSDDVYSAKSPLSSIAINLLNKLELQSNCYYSFAIKCLPEKELPEASLKTCALQKLSSEILAVAPQVILCFGYRALQALMCLDTSLKNSHFIENSEISQICIENHKIRLFFLSSIRDLRDFPHWRKQVWKVLAPLAKRHLVL